jgi:hypothetical protein
MTPIISFCYNEQRRKEMFSEVFYFLKNYVNISNYVVTAYISRLNFKIFKQDIGARFGGECVGAGGGGVKLGLSWEM